MKTITLTVPEDFSGERLDRFVTLCIDELSRTFIQKLIKGGNVTLCGGSAKPGARLEGGMTITVLIPTPVPARLSPENIPLEILYQDADIAVINKQQGLIVHPGAGNYEGTMVNALLFHIKDLSGIGGVERPGIVHRLDRDTSGVIIVAKNDRSHEFLSRQFSERTVEKRYTAIVYGEVVPGGLIEKPIGRHPIYRQKMCVDEKGRYAKTTYSLVRRWPQAAQLDVQIHTGRTHQIRVHLASIGMPVIGDDLYSKKRLFPHMPLMLHSRVLVITHPNGELMRFEAPLPAHMAAFIAERERELA